MQREFITASILPGCRMVGSNVPDGELKDNGTSIAGLPVFRIEFTGF